MAKLRYTLDTRRPLENGTYPLKLSVFINGKGRFMINTGYSVKKDQWVNNVIIGSPLAKDYNDILRFRLTKVDAALIKLEISEEIATLSIKEIQKKIDGIIGTAPKECKIETHSLLIGDAFAAFIESANTDGTPQRSRKTRSSSPHYSQS